MLRLDTIETVGVHVVQYAADELGDQVGLQGPRGIGVAEGDGHVRDTGQHQAFVGHRLGEVDRLTVAGRGGPTEQLHVQTRCGDDDIGLQLGAGGQLDTGFGECLDGVGDDVGLARLDGLEEIPVGGQADSLVPGIVARAEVLVVVEAFRQPPGRHIAQRLLEHLRESARHLVLAGGHRDRLPPVDHVGDVLGQVLVGLRGNGIVQRQRSDVGRRALQHGDVTRALVHQ